MFYFKLWIVVLGGIVGVGVINKKYQCKYIPRGNILQLHTFANAL